jgi:hypothetical protein
MKPIAGTIFALTMLALALVLGTGLARADFVFDMCPSGMDGVVSGTPTSCPFADNVRRSYFNSRSSVVAAYSPVTDQFYAMDCSDNNFVAQLSDGETHPGVLCVGANSAGSWRFRRSDT